MPRWSVRILTEKLYAQQRHVSQCKTDMNTCERHLKEAKRAVFDARQKLDGSRRALAVLEADIAALEEVNR